MALIKDFSKDVTNPHARREGAKRTMRSLFSNLGVFVIILSRANSAKFDINLIWDWGSKHLQCPVLVQVRSTRRGLKDRGYGYMASIDG